MKRLIKSLFKKKVERYLDEKNTSYESNKLQKSLAANLNEINNSLGNCDDVLIRKLTLENQISVAVISIDGLIDSSIVRDIIDTLIIKTKEANIEIKQGDNILSILQNSVLNNEELVQKDTFQSMYTSILSGDTALIIDGEEKAFILDTKGWEKRAVGEPISQTVVRGPQEGFTEDLRTNTALIRRRIKDVSLKVEQMNIGRLSNTDVAVLYMDGIVKESIVNEVKSRLSKINIDAVLDSNYIEELIQDETYTPFPTIFNSERPDTISAGLLEGRVAIVVDGSPYVLLVPVLFTQFFQSAEDYYQRWDISTLLRLLRFMAFFIALYVPSFYIALTTFHQEMLPTTLLISLQAQREGIPFPAFIEALIMEVTFEILREAGIRMPRAVGNAISIVGALVIGEAAVQAGLISPSMVIVVAITAISSFIFPSYNMAISIRMLRFGMMGLAASFGLIGMIMGTIALVLHLCSIRSFGVSYLAPVGPLNMQDQKDTLIRLPLKKLFTRPKVLETKNQFREDNLSKKVGKNDDT